MCGICGVIGLGEDDGAKLVDRMARAIHHRGPDASGQFVEGGVALGHKRLSIIDLGGGRHVEAQNADVADAIKRFAPVIIPSCPSYVLRTYGVVGAGG